MGCFRHCKQPAMCLCKNCGVFLCEKCAISAGEGFVCSESCNENMDIIEKYNQLNRQVLQDNIINANALITDLSAARKGYRASISAYVFIAFIILAIGIDRGNYTYSITFIVILSVLISFSVFRLKSIQQVLNRLLTHRNTPSNND